MSPVDTTLLVPIQLQALQVNPGVRAQGFRRWRMDYTQLPGFGSPEPDAFAEPRLDWAGDADSDGVHLQWVLPAAMRTGHHDAADGTTAYPLAPNRWMVARSATRVDRAPGDRVRTRGWVVESDYLGPDGASPYLDPAARTPTPTRIGRVLPLAGWREPAERPAPFLTAVAPGNITFAAYQPHAVGVFSLHDPADDVEDGSTLSYVVVGWYADPASDVLAPARQPAGLAARLAELGWSVGPDPAGCVADTTVCHGAIRALTYSRTFAAPRPAPAALAVGNTSVDAVSALIRDRAARQPDAGLDPDLLEAFQYDLLHTLDEPDGPALLATRIHDAWFTARPGGSVWQVVAAQPDGAGPPAEPSTADPDWLAELNRAQARYDLAARRLAALQRELYELWWKRGRYNALHYRPEGLTDDRFAAELDPGRPESLAGRVAALRREVERARTDVPWGASQQELAAAMDAYTARHPLPPHTVLKRADLPSFRSAADPVVVIAGVRAGTFDENLGTGADGLLPCRFAGQLVTALTLPLAGLVGPDGRLPDGSAPGPIPPPGVQIPVNASDVAGAPGIVPLTDQHGGVPVAAAFVALQAEAYLLDPAHAAEVAAIAAERVGLPWATAELTTAAEQLMAAGSGVTGTLPAILPQRWSQPWAPLFLEWQTTYYPLPLDTLWTFDGTSYDASWPTGWTYPGPGPGQKPGRPFSISGRSLLTPQPAATFKARLDTYLTTLPEPTRTALSSFAASVDSWDLLAQALSGFNEQLALRSPASLRTPDAADVDPATGLSIAELIGGGGVAMPMVDGPVTYGPPEPGGFQALRAGQFAFAQVRVVDRFGQSIDVYDGRLADALTPTIAEGMVPQQSIDTGVATFIQLPPRLLEPARLDVGFAPAGPGQPSRPGGDARAAGDVVCAWIVPSPLDEALACYAPDGTALGELTETAGLTGPQISWLPAPGSACPTLDLLTGDFPVLGGFLRGLTVAGPAAFADLLRTVDATLWTIDPPGGGDETYLAALAGRPLALVCATLHGRSARPPRTDPQWPRTFDPVPSPVSAHVFPVRVGDAALRGDGLIGYLSYPDGGYFQAAYRPSGLTTDYVRPIDPDSFPAVRFDDAERTDLIVLMDPRLPVHLVTDILPVTTLTLPQRLVADALAAMALTVRFGPLLTDLQASAAGPAIVLPRPPQVDGTWSWSERDGADVTTFDIAPADGAARFPGTPPAVRSGWLRLHGGRRPPQ
ncbi:hypothetical protein GA0070558_1575 [Micromonospora haikouensis]|uniref:Uncharacterized protein n=1 Tax=Micromonospora haikouensis TaxID=686309 RepID=A0A1C4YMV1_9ACTN|nr:hypothetical protein GA0070558_1575 [Micromonospora haikouensis]